MANRAYKYRIYPTTEQRELLFKTFGCCRKVYNEILAHNNSLRDNGEKLLSKFDANKYCNSVLKNTFPYFREVDKFALTNSIYALYNGYTRFFRHEGGFPKFKSRRKSKFSYTTNITNGNISVCANSVKLPKIGIVKAKVHRYAPDGWKIKSATVSMDRDGIFYVSVLYEYSMEPSSITINPENSIGLDFKVSELYADSEGNLAGMPKYTKKYSDRLAREQKKLSKKQGFRKGEEVSNNYKKQQAKVVKINKKIANCRRDFLHKTSSVITKQYEVICIQNEAVSDKIQDRKFSNYRKSVYDRGWYMFTQMLDYKQETLGHKLIIVDKSFPSTKLCSVCGYKNDDLTDDHIRKWVCPVCKASHDRDINAAKNIRNEGLRMLMV